MSDPSSPLQPEALDELLSAELDGELDAAARDLGMSADDAAARIRATPGADDRRSALAAARDLLAEPAPIEELLAARLRAKAVRASEADSAARAVERRRRRNRMLLSVGGMAAAVAAVVALAASLNASHTGANSSSSKSSAAKADSERAGQAPVPSSSVPDRSSSDGVKALGAFTDPHALAVAAVRTEAVDRTLTSPVAAPGAATGYGSAHSIDNSAATKSPPTNPTTSSKSVAGGLTENQARSANRQVALECAAPPQVHVGATPALRATATLAGRPVIVLVFAERGEHVVVVEDQHCKLLNLQMLG